MILHLGSDILEESDLVLIEEVHGILDEPRSRVEEIMKTAVEQVNQPRLNSAMRHLLEAGGKRMRATIPWLVGHATGGAHDGHVELGATLELIHNFTLIHDDIMDDDPLRRGRPSVHVEFDVATALNAGDALFAIAIERLAGAADVPQHLALRIVRNIAGMVRRLSDGQQMDMDFESRDGVSEDEYITMIEGKTAAIFEIAGWGGALIAGASESVAEAMKIWGRELGLCFQIVDDTIDLLADSTKSGKQQGSDLMQGKQTLVVIHALNHATPEQRSVINAVLGQGEAVEPDSLASCLDVLASTGSIDHALKRAHLSHDRAIDSLSLLKEGEAKDLLVALTHHQLEREA